MCPYNGTSAATPEIVGSTTVPNRAPGVAEYLSNVLDEYKYHIWQRQDDERSMIISSPSLVQETLPMFKDRWCGGPEQHVSEFYHRIEPALRLTSFLLNEDYPLLWFCHFTFGERRRDEQGIYIVSTAYSHSTDAIVRVRANLKELGKVISFLFMPREWNEKAWGMSFSGRKGFPRYFRHFKDHDFPPSRSRKGACHPVVAISSKFQDYFRQDYSRKSTPGERYRALYMFAVTLGHEIAHAWIFMGDTYHGSCYGSDAV